MGCFVSKEPEADDRLPPPGNPALNRNPTSGMTIELKTPHLFVGLA